MVTAVVAKGRVEKGGTKAEKKLPETGHPVRVKMRLAKIHKYFFFLIVCICGPVFPYLLFQ